MALSISIVTKYADATLTRLHKRSFHDAFMLAIQEIEPPHDVNVGELKSAVGKELARLKREKDPVQLIRANEKVALYSINKQSEVSFIHEGGHATFRGVRWIGGGQKPLEVEVDGRLLTKAHNRAQEHFRNMRRIAKANRKK
jgi:hypothetical protein